jgi:hypothetical protein
MLEKITNTHSLFWQSVRGTDISQPTQPTHVLPHAYSFAKSVDCGLGALAFACNKVLRANFVQSFFDGMSPALVCSAALLCQPAIRSSGLQSDFGLIKRLILLTVVSRILHSALGNNCLSPSQLTPPVELDSL